MKDIQFKLSYDKDIEGGFIATLKTFKVTRPILGATSAVGQLTEHSVINETKVTTKETTVASIDDIEEIVVYLNRYVQYLEHTLKRITKETLVWYLLSEDSVEELKRDLVEASKKAALKLKGKRKDELFSILDSLHCEVTRE